MNQQPADRFGLDMLLRRSRVATDRQYRRALRLGGLVSEGAARRRTHQHIRFGLVQYETILVGQMLDLERPILRWKPGNPEPDFASMAWQLEKRAQGELRPTRVLFASRKAASIFGGLARGVIKNDRQATHDLHVTAVYLRVCEQSPKLAAHWVGEDDDLEKPKGEVRPDATIRSNGKVVMAIEIGGLYQVEKLLQFHADVGLRRGLPYELW